MTGFHLAVAAFLLLTLALGLVRVVRGPGPANRIMAVQLFGTTGLALVLVLGAAFEVPAAADIAIVFALLAALAGAAFARCYRSPRPTDEDRGS